MNKMVWCFNYSIAFTSKIFCKTGMTGYLHPSLINVKWIFNATHTQSEYSREYTEKRILKNK